MFDIVIRKLNKWHRYSASLDVFFSSLIRFRGKDYPMDDYSGEEYLCLKDLDKEELDLFNKLCLKLLERLRKGKDKR